MAPTRDEGPRLIPLDGRQQSESRLQHYLELAEVALRDPRGRKNDDTKDDSTLPISGAAGLPCVP